MPTENTHFKTPRSARRLGLRHGTWAMHQNLDAKIGTLNSTAAYKRYLYTVYLLRSGIEASLHNTMWPTSFGSWRPSPLSAALQSDMHDLALTPVAPPPFPPLQSSSALLGALYVVEGASLGARILVKQAEALGFNAQFGARHLAQQTNSGEEWATYLTLLDTTENFSEDEAIDAAQKVFAFGLAALQLAEQAAEASSHG